MQRPFSSHFIREALQQCAAFNFVRHATDLLHVASGNNVQHAACSKAASRMLHAVAPV
jgi:hypothetical protein